MCQFLISERDVSPHMSVINTQLATTAKFPRTPFYRTPPGDCFWKTPQAGPKLPRTFIVTVVPNKTSY